MTERKNLKPFISEYKWEEIRKTYDLVKDVNSKPITYKEGLERVYWQKEHSLFKNVTVILINVHHSAWLLNLGEY